MERSPEVIVQPLYHLPGIPARTPNTTTVSLTILNSGTHYDTSATHSDSLVTLKKAVLAHETGEATPRDLRDSNSKLNEFSQVASFISPGSPCTSLSQAGVPSHPLPLSSARSTSQTAPSSPPLPPPPVPAGA